ncbi:MAG TPA: radical SAM protein [Candidatus Binatia bacterium]
MKIVLVQPPVEDFYDTDVRLQPIGLCYMKAAVEKHLPGVDVIVRDYHRGRRQTAAIPPPLAYLTEYYPAADRSPFSTFHRYYHFGASFDEIEADLAALNADVVGISSLFTPYYREALEVARRVKRRSTAPVILGGSHASAAPESLLASRAVDYVVRGEGERPFVEFLQFLLGRKPVEAVPNLAYKKDGEIVFNPIEDNFPIDDLPFPDLGDFAPEHYRLGAKPLTFVITSRSCPHRCSFCSVHTTFGAKYRLRSLENVLDEIDVRYRQGYRIIDFEDDNLTYYKAAFKELCRRIIARYPAGALELVAMNGISYLSLDDEALELMAVAGFSHLNLALVSSDKTVRETTKRPHTLSAYLKIVDKAHRLGLKITSYQILGLPNESLASMIQTLAFNARLPVLLGASPFYRTPNAPIARGDVFADADYVSSRLTAMASTGDDFEREDVYTLFVATRIINFLKGLPLSAPAALADLFDLKWPEERQRIGFESLRRLADTGCLWSFTKTGWVENYKFRPELFRRVLHEMEYLTTRHGVRITPALWDELLPAFSQAAR